MERFAWKGRIKPGMAEEYKRRHDNIWPEMKELLKQAGICNYTIWSDGEELFGYYECEKGIAFAEQTQAGSPIVDRWNDYMQDVLELEMDPETGAQPKMKQMVPFGMRDGWGYAREAASLREAPPSRSLPKSSWE